MADITQIFKSTIKMVKVRQKTVDSIKVGSGDDNSYLGNSNHGIGSGYTSLPNNKMRPPLGTTGGESDESFSAKVKEIVTNISGLKAFLLKNRKAYLAASSKIPYENGLAKLSEAERDKIEGNAVECMKLCKDTLLKYKEKALHKHLTAQHREHRTLVISMVEDYLKVVCQLYSEQKAIRVKRAVDTQKLSLLDYERSRKAIAAEQAPSSKIVTTEKNTATVFNEATYDEAETTNISTEEAQMFREENEQLYNELNSTLDEVRLIEGKVVEIARLQEIFTGKVLEQDTDIKRISDEMVNSTENIVQGNDDIREAMKNNAGMRVWIIFSICVLSFTLLFLDWYND